MPHHEFEVAGDAAPEVERALAHIGRCEDVRFSPDGRLLVLAGFTRHVLLVVEIEVEPGTGPPLVRLTRATEAMVPGLELPHGLAFADDETLIVANRGGGITVVSVHRTGGRVDQPAHEVQAVPVAGAFEGLDSPGSVAVIRSGDADVEVLVCNNHGHTVTRHGLTRSGEGFTVSDQVVLLERWLDVPDGVAASPDGEWLAISDHHPQAVLLYRRTDPLGPGSVPAGVVRGVAFPHGLTFTPDGEQLLVAAAATAELHVFTRPADGWAGVHHPASSVRVLDDETFERGRSNPQEGGPKGVDVSPDGRVVALTSEHLPLVLLDGAAVAAAARRGHPPPDPLAYERSVLDHLSYQRADYLAGVAHARDVIQQARDREASALARATVARAHAVEAHGRAERAASHAAALEATWTFRLLAPFRRAYGRARRR